VFGFRCLAADCEAEATLLGRDHNVHVQLIHTQLGASDRASSYFRSIHLSKVCRGGGGWLSTEVWIEVGVPTVTFPA
jgi:hypothetical protein